MIGLLATEEYIAMIVREPVGVVGLVLSWNFPILMLAWEIGPALAASCSVIVNPAEETSLTALRIAEPAIDGGIPAGVFNMVPGSGPDAGEPLGRHKNVDALSFTGSTETGRRCLRYASESNLKAVTLEMGGKNPAVELDDTENLDRVAAHIVNGAFWNMGENCSASSRHLCLSGNGVAVMRELDKGLYSACVQNGWGTTHETIDLSNDAVDLRELAKLKNEPATWGSHFRVIWQAITGILPVIQRIKRSLESLDGVALS